MNTVTVKLAGRVIRVRTQHADCSRFLRDFAWEGEPDFSVCVTQEDIDRERASYEAANGCGDGDDAVELQALHRLIALRLADFHTFVMHGAAISAQGQGLIFTGHSGVGKSTHIFKWLRSAPETREINGDRPFVTTGEPPMVCGSPWAGKERFFANTSAPLRAVVLLERGEENSIRRVPLADVFPAMCQQIMRGGDISRTRKTLQMLGSLADRVSFYRFRCNNFRDDCFPIAYRALMGKEP